MYMLDMLVSLDLVLLVKLTRPPSISSQSQISAGGSLPIPAGTNEDALVSRSKAQHYTFARLV
jgi:hypothetical protein